MLGVWKISKKKNLLAKSWGGVAMAIPPPPPPLPHRNYSPDTYHILAYAAMRSFPWLALLANYVFSPD